MKYFLYKISNIYSVNDYVHVIINSKIEYLPGKVRIHLKHTFEQLLIFNNLFGLPYIYRKGMNKIQLQKIYKLKTIFVNIDPRGNSLNRPAIKDNF